MAWNNYSSKGKWRKWYHLRPFYTLETDCRKDKVFCVSCATDAVAIEWAKETCSELRTLHRSPQLATLWMGDEREPRQRKVATLYNGALSDKQIQRLLRPRPDYSDLHSEENIKAMKEHFSWFFD